MIDEPEKTATLAVAGLVQATPGAEGKSALRIGPSAGWLVPKGMGQWESEISLIARSDMTAELARSLHATLPFEQIAPKRYPLASEAVGTVPLLGLSANLAADIRKTGMRVHTIGVDCVSSGFYYFAEGGAGEAVRVQANLVEMLAPSLGAGSTNAEIAELVRGAIDRLLLRYSGGAVSELDVEVANALPRLSRDGTGLLGTDLDALETGARSLAERSARWRDGARRLVDALAAADAKGEQTARVPLYGEAKKETASAFAVQIAGSTVSLEARPTWTVSGAPREEPAVGPATAARAVAVPTVARPVAPAWSFEPAAATPPTKAAGAGNAVAGARPDGGHASGATAAAPAPAPDKGHAWPRPAAAAASPASPSRVVAERPKGEELKRAEPARPEPKREALKRPEPARPEPARAEPARAEPSQSAQRPPAATAAVSIAPDELISEPPATAAAAVAQLESTPPVEPTVPSPSEARAASASGVHGVAAAPPGGEAPLGAAASRVHGVAGLPSQGEALPSAPTSNAGAQPVSPSQPQPEAKPARAPRAASRRRGPALPRAAMAPSAGQQRGPFSGFGIFALLVLAVLAYFAGRWIRHHFLMEP